MSDDIDWLQRLADQLAAWYHDPHLRRFGDDPDEPEAMIALTPRPGHGSSAANDPAVRGLPLTRAHLRELADALRRNVYANKAVHDRHQRAEAMARVMVDARRAGEDVGELVGAAANAAAGQLFAPVADRAVALVWGRPGSWEAALLVGWAHAGGTVNNPVYVQQMADLMVQMGNARDDGGDLLSQAMGKAATELGSMQAFAGGSVWEADLRNIGGQYAQVADGWGAS